jgi:hypothetical protein
MRINRRKNMKPNVWSLPVGLSLALIGWIGAPRAAAQERSQDTHAATGEPSGHSHAKSELHGGHVTMTRNHHFETLFSPDGIRIFTYTADQAPQMTEKAKGRVTLTFKDGSTKVLPLVMQRPSDREKTAYFCPMHQDVVQMEPGVCPKCGGMKLYAQDYLFGKADLSGVEPGSLKASVAIEGLAKPETEVTFTETNAVPPPAAPEAQRASPDQGHAH